MIWQDLSVDWNIPLIVDSMIRIGEESDSLEEVLQRTADFYDEEVDVAIQK